MKRHDLLTIFLVVGISILMGCSNQQTSTVIEAGSEKTEVDQKIVEEKVKTDEVYFRLKPDEIGYYWFEQSFAKTDNYTDILTSRESILKGITFASGSLNDQYAVFIYVLNKGEEIKILSDSLDSIHKLDSFKRALIIDINNIKQDIWIKNYYLEAVSKQDREIIYQNEKRFWDFYMAEIASKDEFMGDHWYEEFKSNHINAGIEFYDNGLRIEGYNVFIDSIIENENGYTVRILGDRFYKNSYNWMKYSEIPWPKDGGEKMFTLIMEFDGDYLDIYLNDKGTKFAEFALVDADYARIISTLVSENNVESFEVPWPQRADGSMDYPPPELGE